MRNPQLRVHTPDEITTAWRYHSDADTVFHNRLSSFVMAQSFMVVGYITALGTTLAVTHPGIIRGAIIALAAAYCIFFLLILVYIFNGMEKLKTDYLKKCAIYNTYYDHNGLGEGSIRHIIPYFIPVTTLVFWLVLAWVDFRL